jgi:hypothetical protein
MVAPPSPDGTARLPLAAILVRLGESVDGVTRSECSEFV